jgi:ATP-binding cassette, subfamily B, bacterial
MAVEQRPGIFRLATWSSRYALRRWRALLAVLAVATLNIGLRLLQPWPMKVLVDNVLHGRPMKGPVARMAAHLPDTTTRHDLLAWTIGATVVLFLLGWAMNLASSYAGIAFGQRMVYDLAVDLFAHMERLSLRFHARRPVGDSMRRVTTDSACVSAIVTGTFLPVATAIITLVTMFGVMWKLDRELLLISLGIVPFMAIVSRAYARPLMRRSYLQQEVEGELYSVIERTLSAIPVVKAFGREEAADLQLRGTNGAILQATLASTGVQLQFKILLGLATALGTAAVLWVGAQHVLAGQLTLGSLLVFLAYLGSLYGPIHSLVYTSSTIQGASGSARRVLQILDTEPEITNVPGAREMGVTQGAVALEGVTFGYEAERPVLRQVWLEAEPGETVAIVGPTGVGKSTLMSLIPRFYDPWDGRVLLDGQDVRELQLRSLRAQIALVLQEPFLFPVSLAENIAYGRPDASRAEIEAAATAANAHAFIERLPQGYNTVLGERGATLSGGERQRISIARALLKDAPILILDEPTSALDAETEALLLEALERLMAGRTTFIIAHRLSTIRRADRIAVLQEGRIAEMAPHDALLAQNGIYARLYRRQMGQTTPAQVAG